MDRPEVKLQYDQLLAILESSPDFVATTNRNGRVLWSNATSRAFFDVVDTGEYLERHVSLFDFMTPDSRQRFLDDAIPELLSNGTWVGELDALLLDGSTTALSFAGRAHFGDDGSPEFFSGIGRDISGTKAVERALAASEARMRTLVNSAPIGIFETNAWGACTYVNPEFCAVAGITDPVMALGFGWGRVLHPDDAGAAGSAWAVAIKTDQPFVGQFRFVRGDGDVVWADVKAVPIHDDDGVTQMFLGTIDDITERLTLERARFESAELFRAAFEDAPTGMVLTDVGNHLPEITRANAAFAQLVGRPQDTVVGMDFADLIHPDDLPAAMAARRALAGGDIPTHQMQIRYIRSDGEIVWCLLTRSIVNDHAGQPRYVLGQIADITATKSAQEEVERMAFTDVLTGLPNRRSFVDALDRACATRACGGGRVALLFVDLDHFKTVNDQLGHDAGDELLIEVAQALTASIRSGDMVARLGGDEFAAIITDVKAPMMDAIADRLSSSMQFPRTLADGSTVTVTASIGLAWADLGETMDEFLRRADQAMYQAKHQGRNRIVLADSSGTT